MKPERIEELRNQKLRDGTREVSRDEWLHLLRCARAWAELETWLSGKGPRNMELIWTSSRKFTVMNRASVIIGFGPDLLTATEAALAKAKESK